MKKSKKKAIRRRRKSRGLGQLPPVRDQQSWADTGWAVFEAIPTMPTDSECENSFVAAYLRGRGFEGVRLGTQDSDALSHGITRAAMFNVNQNQTAINFGRDMAERCFKMPTLRALAGLPKKPQKLGQLNPASHLYSAVNQTQAERASGLNIPARARVSEVAVTKAEADSAQCFTAHEALADEAFSIGASEYHLAPDAVTQLRDPLVSKIQRFYAACRRNP